MTKDGAATTANVAPRTKERDVRVAEIEEAAREVFLSRGYQNATIQEVAERAGIAKGTVYLYYKSKEDLYASFILPPLEYLGARLETLLAEVERGRFENGQSLLTALGDLLVDLHYRDLDMAMLYQAFQVGNLFREVSDETLRQLSDGGRRNFGLLRSLFSRAIALGLIRDVDVVKTVDALWGLLIGVAQVELNKFRWTKKDHFRDTLAHAFLVVGSGLSTGNGPARKVERRAPRSGRRHAPRRTAS